MHDTSTKIACCVGQGMEMSTYRIKPFAAPVDAPAWVQAGQVYEGEVDLLSPSFVMRQVVLRELVGKGSTGCLSLIWRG